MKKKVLLILMMTLTTTLMTVTAFSREKHRHHKSHVHGSGVLMIAFQGTEASVELKTPAESILGFEHLPKTEAEKLTFTSMLEKFEKNIGQMIQFSPELGCRWTKVKIEQMAEPKSGKHSHRHEGEHSDFVAQFNVVCEKSPQATEINFDFSELKRLKNLEATVLVESIQKKIKIKSSPQKLLLQKVFVGPKRPLKVAVFNSSQPTT